jgi:hypothetical protein
MVILKQWEYYKEQFCSLSRLNDLGRSEWEVCGVTYNEQSGIETFYFKKLRNTGAIVG